MNKKRTKYISLIILGLVITGIGYVGLINFSSSTFLGLRDVFFAILIYSGPVVSIVGTYQLIQTIGVVKTRKFVTAVFVITVIITPNIYYYFVDINSEKDTERYEYCKSQYNIDGIYDDEYFNCIDD